MARSRDAGYVSAFEVGVANTEIKDESYKSHSVSRMRTRDRGYVSKTTVAGFIDESFESIATTTVGSGGSSSITFSSIPATYKHLQIRIHDMPSSNHNITMRFNSDTGSNYSYHNIQGNGATVTSNAVAPESLMYLPGTSATSTHPLAVVCDILDYANTNKYKTVRALGGADNNGDNAGVIAFRSNNWRSTSAVTSIELSGNFAQYSHFALYGIKG